MSAHWGRIPAELRERRQWVVAYVQGADKIPLSVNGQNQFYSASPVDPTQWLSFEHAAASAAPHGYGIGYVLHKDDPFTCIDFDVVDADSQKRKGHDIDPSKWTTRKQFEWFWDVAQRYDSYTEVSHYGKGIHIWVRGKIGRGLRKESMELYSQERYIITTGQYILDRPIRDRQDWLLELVQLYRGDDNAPVDLIEIAPVMEDSAIVDMARAAENGDKFIELWEGRWEQFGHPSRSEADVALMSMFTFYSKSNEQCRRIFRQSPLGQREKVQKDNRYLDFTLRYIRTRMANEAKVEYGALEKQAETLQLQRGAPLHLPDIATAVPTAPPASMAVALAGPSKLTDQEDELPWPPDGLCRSMAGYIYDSAPRPVKEVAIIGALGLLAGICGKAWHIPNSGLNIYMILVARSAIGKEAMHSGVSSLITAAVKRCPAAMLFTDFTDFASGPALVKACAAQSSLVNIAGELGRKLKRIAYDDGRDSGMSSLRTVMINLYQKSGPQSIVGGITYSNKNSNIASVSGVAFSMIGETTPKTFYESLTESMMEDGFLSRFTVIEYNGDRVPLNTNPAREPETSLADALGDLCMRATEILNSNSASQPVSITHEAAQILQAFEKECDTEINSNTEEIWRQMWNRASLKVMRISALLAVSYNWINPVIQIEHVNWALNLIRRDMQIMIRRIEAGDVGSDDRTREMKLISIIRAYLRSGATEGYGVPTTMQEKGIIPYKYLQMKTNRNAAYLNHKLGATVALQQTLKSVMDAGYLKEMTKDTLSKEYNFHGKCFIAIELPGSTKNLA